MGKKNRTVKGQHYFRRLFSAIPKKFKQKVIVSFFLSLVNGFLDLISLAALIPVIILFIQPGFFQSSSFLQKLFPDLENQEMAVVKFSILMGLILLFIAKNLFSIWSNNFQIRTAYAISTELSKKALQSFFNLSYLEYSETESADVVKKTKVIPHDFANYILLPTINIFTEGIIAIIIISALLIYKPFICLLLGLILSPILLFWRWYRNNHLDKIEDDFRGKYPKSIKYIFHGIQGFIDIKTHRKEDFFIQKVIDLKRSMNENYGVIKLASFITPKILETTLIISIAAIFVYGLFINPSVSIIPLLTILAAGFYRLVPSITKIFNDFKYLRSYHYALEEVLDTPKPEHKEMGGSVEFSRSLVLKNISFRYGSDQNLLNDINLQIIKGSCIGVSGESGSGKTTLIKMITGLIEPHKGEIMIDDELLNEKNQLSWLSKIGYFQQQPVILSASLRENIAFGDEAIDVERLQNAIKKAHLKDFIDSLPQKLDTEVGEFGIKISGGQSQRIALARALYRDVDILILDEISNNLDQEIINEIKGTLLDLLAEGKTVIIIDHGNELADIYDKLYLVSNGSLTERNIIHGVG